MDSPAEGGADREEVINGGITGAVDWSMFKAEARRILRAAPDQKKVWEQMKRRIDELLSGNPGVNGGDRMGKKPDMRKESMANPWSILEEPTGKVKPSHLDGFEIHTQIGLSNSLLDKDKCTNFVPFVANLEEDESYFSIREGCFLSSIHTIEDNRSFPSLYHSGSSNMAERGDLEKSGEGIKEKGEILGCVPAPMSELREPANSMGGEPPVLPPTPDNEGRSMLRRTPGVVLR
ncbi:hypothetical protein D1007_43276 [Hordeum vulgare]|nr:hypothetical protein D1007_43276 [Hordeum vulgare]